MRRLLSKITLSATLMLALAACSAPKKVPYLVDAETIPTQLLEQSQSTPDPVLGVGDLLNIQVTGVNMSAMAPFNKGTYINHDGNISSITRSSTNFNSNYNSLDNSTEYYLVNSDGCIDFPIIGKIAVAGLHKGEVCELISNSIYPKYVTEKPAVDIRLMNFRVTVTGAVRNPGVYQSRNERMTFLEAISMAGDLDIKGDRENILLYRTNADGSREVVRINLHDNSLLTSPYYTLKQNDFIYVTPNKSMSNSAWQMNPAISATITVVGGMSSLASLVVGIINLTKD